MEKPLNCTIKNPVNLMLGDVKVDMLCGCKVIDITFPNIMSPEVIHCFIIHALCINYYMCNCASAAQFDIHITCFKRVYCLVFVADLMYCVENFTASDEL